MWTPLLLVFYPGCPNTRRTYSLAISQLAMKEILKFLHFGESYFGAKKFWIKNTVYQPGTFWTDKYFWPNIFQQNYFRTNIFLPQYILWQFCFPTFYTKKEFNTYFLTKFDQIFSSSIFSWPKIIFGQNVFWLFWPSIFIANIFV